MKSEGILVVDYGSQVTQNMASQLRKLGYYTEIIDPEDVTEQTLDKCLGIFNMGGPDSVYDPNSPKPSKALLDAWTNKSIPKLNTCYSHQLDAFLFGGEVKSELQGEYDVVPMKIINNSPVFKCLAKEQLVQMNHGDQVTKLPPGAKLLAKTKISPIAAYMVPERNCINFQFHSEVSNTPNGLKMIKNFLEEYVGQPTNPWSYERFINEKISEIKEFVGERTVVLLTSGGKDSTLTAKLLQLAEVKVDFLHVKNGTERKHDVERNKNNLAAVKVNINIIDTTSQLEKALNGITDAETKRLITGRRYFEDAMTYGNEKYGVIGKDWILAQGTIYPDFIESQGRRHADRIKTHHNMVPEMNQLREQNCLLEPLLYLFKNEVEGNAMYLAKKLNLPAMKNIFAKQHPFPGPGLVIRCLCSTGRYADLFNKLSEEQAINKINELTIKAQSIASNYGFNAITSPVKTVGQQGGGRTYAPATIIWNEFNINNDSVINWELIAKASANITNTMKGEINRVLYAFAPVKIKNIKLHEAYVTKERLSLLQEADDTVMSMLESSGLINKMKQCPTIVHPTTINNQSGETIIIRPFVTENFMTGDFARLPVDFMKELTNKLLNLGYSGVLFDVSKKPPGTTEHE